ncbi:GNAT family N-acetyltransferase [Pseudomonas sp. MTM4]|nr:MULTISPECIES: GNAT family N-acetyltransferase [Pseudomonadaceae]MBA1279345.1 GNAT family N-acetyltransferase [Stutzerimonas stutzeri]MBC8648570.1 GNAT family N-acetyltransferase [Pseudomonas sp. MT4]QXY90504.1 GNAT family N-acetyltransferase [Pseudomonas sp. MTM4]
MFYGQPSNLELARNFIAERIRNDESVIFYARDTAESYIGFTQLYPVFSSISARRSWILNDLYVAESARGRGVGRMLMNRAREHAIATGATGVSLETAKANAGAQRLYESLGYARDDEFYSYFLDLSEG